MTQKTIYLAGKMLTQSPNFNAAKFEKFQKILEKKGFNVINPVLVIGEPYGDFKTEMKIRLESMETCDAVFFLPDSLDAFETDLVLTRAMELNLDMYAELTDFKNRAHCTVCDQELDEDNECPTGHNQTTNNQKQ